MLKANAINEIRPSEGGLRFRSVAGTPRPGERTKLQQQAFGVLEQIVLFIAIAAFFGVSGFSSEQKLGQSEIVNTLALGTVLAFALPTALYYRKPAIEIVARCPLLVAFLMISVFSVIWSEYPALTFKRDGSLGVPIILALVVVCRHKTHDAFVMVGRFILVLAVLSAIVAILFPSVGLMSNREIVSATGNSVTEGAGLAGAWRGITAHKNTLGYIVSVGFGIYFWRFCVEKQKRILHLLTCLFLCAVAYKSRSATSMLAIFFYAAVLVIVLTRRSSSRFRALPEALAILAVIGSIAMLPVVLEIVTEFLGKDLTLTGRVPLWDVTLDFIAARPLLGYGYGAFWVDGSPQVQQIYNLFQWEPPNAHNAYLELALEVGLPGAIVGTLLLLGVVVSSYRIARSGGPAWTAFVAIFSVVFAITNLVDTLLLRMGDIYCFLLVLSQFALVKYRLEQLQSPDQITTRRFGKVAPAAPSRQFARPAGFLSESR